METADKEKIKWNLVDTSIILVFALFACFYQINRAAGNSIYLFHSTDNSNIAGFAIAKDHPELFSGDEILSNEKFFRFYSTIHIPITRLISRVTGDYASPLILLVGLHIFIQAFGFYLLGRILFRKRYWAMLLAVLNLAHVPLAMGEFWGIYIDTLPRVSFQALLPFLLSAVIYWRNKPKVWPLIMAAAGIMMYIHPVSAPAWGFCVWMSFWFFQPPEWKLIKKLGLMALLGVTFLASALPFVFNYFGIHLKVSPQEFDLVFSIIKSRYLKGFFDIPYGIRSFFANIAFTRVFLFGVFASLFIFFKYRKERAKLVIFYIWAAGILIISVLIPVIEHDIALKNKVIPEAYNLVRNFKYIFPIMLIFCLWFFVATADYAVKEKNRKMLVLIAFFVVFAWSSRQFYKEVNVLNRNGFFLFNPNKVKFMNTIDSLNALKRITPAGARIMSVAFPQELAIRYYAQRPLVYSAKDGGILNYIDTADLIKWYEKSRMLEDLINSFPQVLDTQSRINSILKLSGEFGADFCLADRSLFPDASVLLNPSVAYYNDMHILLKVGKKEGKAR